MQAPSTTTNIPVYPVSLLQQAMLFAGRAHAQVRFALQLEFPVDRERLLAALRDVLREWEVLRTYCVRYEDGSDVQRIVPTLSIELEELPRRFIAQLQAGNAPIMDLWAWIDGNCEHDKSKWKLASLVAADRSWLVGRLPATAFDERSVELLANSLSDRLKGMEQAPPIQYADVAQWMNDVPSGASRETLPAAEYWRRGTHLDVVELEVDGTVPPRWERLASGPDSVLACQLETICTATHWSLESVIVAHLALILAPLSSDAALRLGVVREGRALTELVDCPGRFAYIFPILVDAGDGTRLQDTIDRIPTQLRAADDWDLRFDMPLHYVQGGRLLPELTVGLARRRDSASIRGAVVDDASQGKLHLQATMVTDALALEWRFDNSRLPAEAVRLLSDRFRTLIEHSARQGRIVIDRMAIPGLHESARLAEWRTPVLHGHAKDFLTRFHDAVREYPERIALDHNAFQFTYRELRRQAHHLAVALIANGVVKGNRIAIVARNPCRQVAAILAAFEVGAAFVPLDDTWPAARIAAICADAGVALTVSDEALAGESSIATASIEPISRPSVSGSLAAYLVYTSGSTGKPKGVEVSRANLAHYLASVDRLLDGLEINSWAGIGTFAADLTFTALFGALANAAQLRLLDRELLADVPRLIEQLRETPVDLLKTVPSLIGSLLLYEPTGSFLPSRRLFMGGEAIPRGLCDALQRVRPDCGLINHYGPTETTIGAAADSIENPPKRFRGVSDAVVGRPMPHASIAVLDLRGQQVGVGIAGEIWIGGAGVANGYAGAMAATAASFVPDPSATAVGGRMYRTGDMGRWLVDGRLEFLGRSDRQIKIRGYRVELAEVEQGLRALAGVTDAAVIAQRTSSGEVIGLHGFVTIVGDITTTALASQCRAQLPTHMVPASIEVLVGMPRLTNGKLDHRALEARAGSSNGAAEMPDDPVQQRVATILGDVLGRDPLSAHDDFFACGGNSILAIRAVARLNREFARQLSPQSLFEHPTCAALAMQISVRPVVSRAIVPIARENFMPLSQIQQRLWFASRLLDPAAFNVPMIVSLNGQLDLTRLAAAIMQVSERHEILRCRFMEIDDQPMISAIEQQGAPVEVIDASAWSDAAIEQAIESYVTRPFELAAEPPLRACLFSQGHQQATLAVVFHHIASDAWSIEIFISELAHLLATADRRGSDLPMLPIQYIDYAAWQKARIAGAGPDERQSWRRYLEGSSNRIEFDVLAPAGLASGGAEVVRRRLPQGLIDELTTHAQSLGISLNAVLLGTFLVLLRKISREDDLVVGTPLAERARPELESLIGAFFHLLPLRLRVNPAENASQLWQRVHREQQELWKMHDLPPDAETVELPRGSDPLQPWFNIVFTHRKTIASEILQQLPGLSISLRRPERVMGHYDLFCAIETSSLESTCLFEFRRDRTSLDWVQRIAEWFVQLLMKFAADPRTLIAGLSLGGSSGEISSPALSVSEDLFTRLRRYAAIQPQAPAVRLEDRWLDYAGLLEEIERIAAGLHDKGLSEGQCVAVSLRRSGELPLAILAIWRAGLVYLPVDPAIPLERQRAILADARPAAILLDDVALTSIDPSALRALDLAGLRLTSAALIPPKRTDQAYLIYTSGSTGQPKGVSVSWRTLAPFLAGMSQRLELGPSDRVLASSSIGFDISILEFVLALYCGGSIEVTDEGVWQDPAQLDHTLASGITVLQATPSAWRLALPHLSRARLRHALIGGEAVPGDLAEALQRCAAMTWNVYGPTEATVWVAAARVGEEYLAANQALTVAIGEPLPGVSLGVYDVDGQACPDGMAGELHIGGTLVADGYRNHPRLTAERFVPDETAWGARRFRSGDLVAANGQGQLRFLGRIDGMVKLRGYRIELDEIDSVLRRHEAVADAAVRVAGADGDGRFLAAYLVPSSPGFFETSKWRSEIRTFLASQLPAYMLPASFETISALPTNASGKLDRRRLPEPRQASTECADLSGMERIVADCIEKLLGCAVAADDDFFVLGGNSLTAARLCVQLEQDTGRRLDLRDVFRVSSVAGIAQLLEGSTTAGHSLPRLHAAGAGEGPLSPYQQGIWLAEQRGQTGATYNLSATLRIDGAIETGRLRRALDALCAEQEQLRVVIGEKDHQLLQRVERVEQVEFQEVDLSQHPDAAARSAELIARWRATPFDMQRAGYCRFGLIRLAPERQIFCIDLHHAIADEWSWRILLERVQVLYGANAGPALARPVQYLDYARAIHAHRDEPWMAGQLAYWIEHLAQAPPLLELPFARPRPPRRSFRGDAVDVHLPARVVEDLHRLARRQRTTLFTTLVASYCALLYLHAGRSDVLIGTAAANRRLTGTANMVGNFSNVLALRLMIVPEESAAMLVKRASAVVHGALDHQEYPFSELVSRLGIQPSPAFAPIVQNFLVLHNTPKPVSGSGWRIEPIKPAYQTSEYDLDLGLSSAGAALDGYLRFNTDLYARADVELLAARFATIAKRIATCPEDRVSALLDATSVGVTETLAI